MGPNKRGEIQALHANTSNKGKKRKFKWKRGNNHKSKDFSKIQCYKCDKFGHTHRFCPERKKAQATIAEVKEVENRLFFLALSSELNSNKHMWIIDNGASRHITGFGEQFETFEGHSTEEVTIGDNSTYPVKGIGTYSIQLRTGVTLQLKDVLFVPGIKRNLVSISGLADQGYCVTFHEDKVLL